MRKPRGRPTIEDVGREAGVSQTTVSYVLSGSRHAERISPETKQRILEAARRLGYSRNSIGAALQRGYMDTLVLLAVTWDLAAGHAHTTMSISRAAAGKGLATIVHVAGDDAEAKSFLGTVSSLHPYGLLLLWDSAGLPADDLLNLSTQGLPIVDLMPSSPRGVVSVTADREQGYFLATRHLIELGHRRIGMMLDTTSRGKTSNRKLAGYKRALRDAGIEFQQNLLEEVSSFGFEAGTDGLRKLLDRHPNMTAVICINDPMALGAVAAAQELGLDVPGDLSVVGYGAHGEGAYFRPRLTTLGIPSARIAEAAVKALTKMRTEPDSATEPVYEPMDLIVRESTGPAKGLGSRV